MLDINANFFSQETDMNTITISNKLIKNDIAIGIIHLQNFTVSQSCTLKEKLDELIQLRKSHPLTEKEEKIREECRNILRNGKYKPTGRGKPASEYLLRSALEDNFPIINNAVDANNYISLKYLIPISIWDIDLAQSNHFIFRLGKENESYIFNHTGQVIELQDLITGFSIHDDIEIPMVTPIKDSLKTKIQSSSHHIASALYFPTSVFSEKDQLDITKEFLDILLSTSENTVGTYTIAFSSQTLLFE